MERYRRAGWADRHLQNPIVAFLVGRLGRDLRGCRLLEVRGRTSGKVRTTPVNVLNLDGERYLVSPRGESHWARNLRAAGEGRLRIGRRVEPFRAVELPDEEKAPVLKAYLQRWRKDTSALFTVSPDAPEEEFAAVASLHPVFRLGGSAGQPS